VNCFYSSVKKSYSSVKKVHFFTMDYFFSRWRKSHDKPDLDVPWWMGAHLTYLDLSTGKDKQVIAF
jgi:hypothetical protein